MSVGDVHSSADNVVSALEYYERALALAQAGSCSESGQIALDTPDLAPDLGFLGRRDLVTAIVMHELGHVVGADHAPDGSQLMSAENTGRTDWNDGDRYVLATLGQGRCGSGH